MSGKALETNQLPTPRISSRRLIELMEQDAPVLVEVRFPNMGTASDWYLVRAAEEFDAIWEKLGSNVEVRAASVWDVTVRGEVVVRK